MLTRTAIPYASMTIDELRRLVFALTPADTKSPATRSFLLADKFKEPDPLLKCAHCGKTKPKSEMKKAKHFWVCAQCPETRTVRIYPLKPFIHCSRCGKEFARKKGFCGKEFRFCPDCAKNPKTKKTK